MNEARRALTFFLPSAEFKALEPVAGGNINRSFQVELQSGEKYLLQRLSPAVFPHPGQIMTNLIRVTEHINAKNRAGAGEELQVSAPVAAPDGSFFHIDDEKCCWRLLSWIDHSRTLAGAVTSRQARELGRMLGHFHLFLADLDPASLYDPLPGFHHTPTCLAACNQAMAKQPLRGAGEKECTRFVELFRDRATILEKNRPHLCRTIIHGDPKVANFLFAENQDMALALIDLDTVMPGLLLHDLGDALRSCCNPQGEEGEPEKIIFDQDLFAAFLHGYAEQATPLLTDRDMDLLIDAPMVIAFELGLRFFTDYLNGNTYFRVSQPDQNLDRALVQFHLAASIEEQRGKLDLLAGEIMMGAISKTRHQKLENQD